MTSRASLLVITLFLVASPALSGDFTAEVLSQLSDVESKILQLEQAVPQDKFTWRPAAGVRSISEVYTHIAGSNYLMMKIIGFDAPPESKWSLQAKDWETRTTDRAQIQEMLKKSFAHVRASLAKVSDQRLEQKVDFFGKKVSTLSALFSSITHLHEHLGQSIAYARSNGVVPPWTLARQSRQ